MKGTCCASRVLRALLKALKASPCFCLSCQGSLCGPQQCSGAICAFQFRSGSSAAEGFGSRGQVVFFVTSLPIDTCIIEADVVSCKAGQSMPHPASQWKGSRCVRG
ncbi:unnamed protein product [Durusdinium trenchii]|uniref:Secreted protein n=2 Tax=Durusdinium trenchii TaxID=1381693 RepID=A0ABP0N1B0_9DINO